jgi:putative ABC transport system permease protein
LALLNVRTARARTLGPLFLIGVCLCSLDLFAGAQRKQVQQAENRAVFQEKLGHLAIMPAGPDRFAPNEITSVQKIAAGTPGVTLVARPALASAAAPLETAASAIAIYLSDPSKLPSSRDALLARLKRAGLSAEIHPGPERSESYLAAREQAQMKLQSMLGAVLAAICAVMVASASMNCLERRREHAMLRALGVSPRGLFAHVIAEGLVVALAGIALGFLSSTSVSWIGNHIAMASNLGLSLELDPVRQIATVAVVLVVVLLSVLWPAWKAARAELASGIGDMSDRAA